MAFNESTHRFPEAAYAPDGTLWWRVQIWPGKKKMKFGAERRIMAWLAFNKQVGDTFTTTELRAALGEDDVPNNQEHFQRRQRELRKDGWEIPSTKYDRTLESEQYRLEVVGWHPGLGVSRPTRKSNVSAATARRVLDRDGARCMLCGIGSGEPHPRNHLRPAVMTVGHVLAGIHSGPGDISNLRAECTLCNEPLRAEAAPPPRLDELVATMRRLPTAELRLVDGWIKIGYRTRSRVDQFYDQLRLAAPGDRDDVAARLSEMLRR